MACYSLIFAYLMGGVTFVPLLALLFVLHAYFLLPQPSTLPAIAHDAVKPHEKDRDLEDKLASRTHEPDVAAGYFAVCREYVPSGVNGKPPERTTPAGETITAESPSVYQSMYRTIFDRGKSQTPTMEAGKLTKKARNVFYVVLRHNHLVLFDNSEQLEVRHVISLAHHDVDIYAGGGPIPEGELWIKRNCIRLKKNSPATDHTPASAPFFLFSDNCSDKEDFYHALLYNQGQDQNTSPKPPKFQIFGTDDMIKLIRQLHTSSEDFQQTRWFNAFTGRLFLALYQQRSVEQFIRNKITKKMARVPKPALIKALKLEQLHMGDSAPFFGNFKLREMTVDGTLVIEADVRYSGNFKLVIAAMARIELGSRFKAREVNMILAGTLQKFEGHLLLKVKPPPSNRLWISFENQPRFDLHLEPIVSSRQITYGVILRAIESRLREVISETVVLPNWDDSPFLSTEQESVRGGIWQPSHVEEPESTLSDKLFEPQLVNQSDMSAVDGSRDDLSGVRRRSSRVNSLNPASENASVSGSTPSATASSPSLTEQDREPRTGDSLLSSTPPKAMRSHSFAPAATPVLSSSPASMDAAKQRMRGSQDAASAMKMLSDLSPETSPVGSPEYGSHMKPSSRKPRQGSSSVSESQSPHRQEFIPSGSSGSPRRGSNQNQAIGRRSTYSGGSPSPQTQSSEAIPELDTLQRSAPRAIPKPSTADRAKTVNSTITSATSAARNWSMGLLHRQNGSNSNKAEKSAEFSSTSASQPMGRGHPLPPPGVPLPRPDKGAWPGSALNSLRRKPVPSAASPASSRRSSASAVSVPASKPDSRQPSKPEPFEDVIVTVGAPLENVSGTTDEHQKASEDGDSLGTSASSGEIDVKSKEGFARDQSDSSVSPNDFLGQDDSLAESSRERDHAEPSLQAQPVRTAS